jgi:hypothetical protein
MATSRRAPSDLKTKESLRARREMEARLGLENLGIFGEKENQVPLFGDYSGTWLRQNAEIECEPSTVAGYKSTRDARVKFP